MIRHPFICSECAQHPDSDFVVLRPDAAVDDWLIAYSEQQLIHLHFGSATTNEQVNLAEAKAVVQFLYDVVGRYPGKKFFIILDSSRADNSEFVPPESLAIYKEILQHPQLGQGAVYGGTAAFGEIINLLLWVTGRQVVIVPTKAEADAAYRRWLGEQQKKID